MAFLLIIVLFIVIFMIIFAQMQTSLQTEINESNGLMMEHTKSIIDTTVGNLKTSASQLSLDNTVRTMLRTEGEWGDREYFSLYEVTTMLRQMRALNSDIEAIAILDIEKQQVYSTDGSTTLPSYYDQRYADPARTYEEWLELFQVPRVEFFFTTGPTVATPQQRQVHYVRSLGGSSFSKEMSSCVIFTVTDEAILAKLNDLQQINQSQFYIVDGNQNLILSSDGSSLPTLPAEQMIDTSGMFDYRFEDGTRTVFYTYSALADWTYISVFHETGYMDELNLMRYYCFGGLFVAVLFGILLTWYFIKRNYMPIQNLMDLFGGQGTKAEPLDENEYHAIESFIRRTIRSNAILDKQVYEQRRILRLRVLERLLKGRPRRETLPVAEELKRYDVVFPYPYFAVMLFFVEEEEEDEKAQDEDSYTYQETVFIISNVVEELIGEKNMGLMTDCEGLVACVVNLKEENRSSFCEDLKDITVRANSFIYQNFGISFTVSISSVVDSLEEVHEAYEEALDVMNYKEALGVAETLCYDEIQDTGTRMYNYPFSMEQRLSNMIKTGNYEDAARTIDSVFESNVEKNLSAPNAAQYIMIGLTSTISRTLNELTGEADGTFNAEMLPVETLLKCKTVPEMKEALHTCLKTICENVKEATRQNENWIKKDVLPYISENYADVNMSVANIAEQFGVHPVYLSRLFKEQVGEGMLEYITKFRIERAKEVLRTTKLMLDDVALKVGYNNARTFSRAFKKTEGITPGKYREIYS